MTKKEIREAWELIVKVICKEERRIKKLDLHPDHKRAAMYNSATQICNMQEVAHYLKISK